MTDTALNTMPENDSTGLRDRARDYASGAQDRIASAGSATLDAAREHPYAAAGVVAGVAAAVGGLAYAATQLGSGSPKSGTAKKAKSSKH